jgi:hypothetical protein
MAQLRSSFESDVVSDAEVARFDAMSARQERQLAWLEANQARIQARAAVAAVAFKPIIFRHENLPVVCPRVRVKVPRVRIPVSVQVEGPGPI